MADDDLDPFEGKPVIRCKVKITNAGDGLSDALKVDPVELHVNQRVFYVLEAEVDAIQFKRVSPGGSDMERVHVLRTQRITAVDGADVGAYLDDAEQHVRRALAEISDDQLTIDDAAADAAESNGAGGDEVTGLVDEVKKARAAKKAAASTGAP